ncbi:MAG: hypothetical protein LQ341_004284, partial [Variospora aurantia]
MDEPYSATKRFGNISSTIYPTEITFALLSRIRTLASEDAQILFAPQWNEDRERALTTFIETMYSILIPRIDRFATEDTFNVMTPATLEALRRVVLHKSEVYLASFPGKDTLVSNEFLHRHISSLNAQKKVSNEPYDIQTLVSVDTQVEYRLQFMQAADIYVSALGLTAPYGDTCARWDGTAPHAARQRWGPRVHARILQALNQSKLFPGPELCQGLRRFKKPVAYLATAIQISDIDEETLLPIVIQELLAIKKEVIGAKVEALSRLEIVREAGRIYLAASSKPRTR